MRYAWDKVDEEEVNRISEMYKSFINHAKTEYEVIKSTVKEAERNGFKNLEETENLSSGDKVYWVFREKLCFLAQIGENTENLRIIGAHADSPRIELKIKPVEEKKEENLGVLKVSYYGGFYPYLWLNRPLELRGVVFKEGKRIDVKIDGIIISDQLPHLSKLRMEERKAGEVIKWEEMKALAVNKRIGEEDGFKKLVYKLISEKLGIDFTEEDFIRAHLQLVPAGECVDIGLDSSMIGAYGHDDKVCCFAGLRAFLEKENNNNTCILMLVDKEEIGSESDTSAKSEGVKYFFEKIIEKTGVGISLRELLINSKGISADVSAGVTPGFEDAYDIENSPILGGGMAIERFLDYSGRYRQNEPSIKYVDWLIEILNKRKIPWQGVVSFSKTDPKLGGGGTISAFMARTGMEVIDAGIPVIGMHSPLEIISKADLYSTYLGYKAFYEE